MECWAATISPGAPGKEHGMELPGRIDMSNHSRGYVLVAFALALLLTLGSAGLTFDIGRMYITRNEAQSYCDAAALYAAKELDRTAAGINRARAAALATPKLWNFGTTPFDPSRTIVEFATAATGPWSPNPSAPADYVYSRVTTSVNLPMFLMPVVTQQYQASVAASATAKQVPASGTPNNIFPFAPFWIPPGGTAVPPGAIDPAPDQFGMIPARTGQSVPNDLQTGGVYTLRGPSNLKKVADDMCMNDKTDLEFAYRKESGQPDRGFIWDTKSTKDISDAILGNAVPQDGHSIDIGDNINEVCDFCRDPGNRQATIKAIRDRVASDTNATSPTYKQYVNAGGGNSRRLVVVPVATGTCGSFGDGTYNAPCPVPFGADTVVGFASFFLLPASSYQGTGNDPFCAEYVGPWVPNSVNSGTGGGGGGTGFGIPMLTR
jgi:Flp pilus assembly protein TadG